MALFSLLLSLMTWNVVNTYYFILSISLGDLVVKIAVDLEETEACNSLITRADPWVISQTY